MIMLLKSFRQVTEDSLHYKNKISPYQGMKLRGRVEQTYLRGQKIFDRVSGFKGMSPVGRLL